MPYYESVFIARQDISPQQVDAMTERFSTILKENGGDVPKTEYWGLKNLAYRIKKYRKGHYVLMNIDAPSDALLEMERNMRLSEDVVRLLTIRVDALEEGPSIMMQTRQTRDGHRGHRDRDDRPGRGRDGRPGRDARPDRGSEAATDGDKPAAEAAPASKPEKSGE